MVFFFRRQPLKGLYLMYALLSILTVRLPYWTIKSLLPSLRPRRSWTLKKCILIDLYRYITVMNQKVLLDGKGPDHRTLKTDDDVKGLWVDSVPDLIIGDVKQWAKDAKVEPIRIPGYWYHKKGLEVTMGQKPDDMEKVAYFLHGGGYVSLSAHPDDITAVIPRALLKYCAKITRVFALEYRLSTAEPLQPDNAFPAALLDAIAGYNYLVNVVGYSPSQIIVAGDSAGGNLALALTRYVIENAVPSLRAPDALLLLSPWSDLGPPTLHPCSSSVVNTRSDYLGVPSLGASSYAVRAFLGPLATAASSSNMYISPASAKLTSGGFKGFPRSFISCGDAEVLLDQIRILRERMQADIGAESVEYHEAKDSVHDFIVFDWHQPQRDETLRLIAKWVSNL